MEKNKRTFRQKWTHFKRVLKVTFGKLASNERRDRRMPKPKMDTTEEQAVRIWTKVVHQADSELMYNPKTHEAYAVWDSPRGTVYLFLESQNLRVINTVVGYDIHLSSRVEQWCDNIFTREVDRRRKKFKKQAESKVVHSLDSLETRLEGLDGN
jgi:hypothetical protein